MKFSAAVAATLAGTLATANANYFSVIAARSGAPFHLQSLSASGESIWIGKDTEAYCPKQEVGVKNCPAGNHTNFAGLPSASTLSMGTVVPGGQEVYVDHKTGAIKYTIAHSASVPEGDFTQGWRYKASTGEGSSFGQLTRKNALLACPVDGNEAGPWQVFVQVKGARFSKQCLGFDALTVNETSAAAWEYE